MQASYDLASFSSTLLRDPSRHFRHNPCFREASSVERQQQHAQAWPTWCDMAQQKGLTSNSIWIIRHKLDLFVVQE